MKSLLSHIYQKIDNFRRKIWLKVYLAAGRRVDTDELWDPIFRAEVRKRMLQIGRLYGMKLAKALADDPLAVYPDRDIRDGTRERRDSRLR